MNACSNQEINIWVTAVVLPTPTPGPKISSSRLECLFFRLEKWPIVHSIRTPIAHTFTVSAAAHLTSRPVTFSPKSVAWQMKNLLSFSGSCSYQEYESNKDQEDPKEGKGLKKRDERRRTEKGKDHFRACALWGIKLQMTRAMDQFSPPPLGLSTQAEHTTIWLLTTHSDHKIQLISTKHAHTQCCPL